MYLQIKKGIEIIFLFPFLDFIFSCKNYLAVKFKETVCMSPDPA